jgi:hypothetical protein
MKSNIHRPACALEPLYSPWRIFYRRLLHYRYAILPACLYYCAGH